MINLYKNLLKPVIRYSQLRWLSTKRPPVVTIMGHVDHGKTTLLDCLRKSRIVDQEFGGITQHIGAFVVPFKKDKVTFIDTPGHAAFAAMRKRGSSITDIIILVIACEDGVMEQTKESINCAKQNGVPMIVAINKCDRLADDEKKLSERMTVIRRQLIVNDVVTEPDGGDVQIVKISALKGTGVDDLKESVVALAETLELQSEVDCMVSGHIIESSANKQYGKLSTLLVDRGKLKKGTILVSGRRNWAKVRNIMDESGKQLSECGPGEPAKVTGWREDELPAAGDLVIEVQDEKEARSIINRSAASHYETRKVVKSKKSSTNATNVFNPDLNTLHLILKCDADGSLGTILDIFDTYDMRQINLDVAHFGVGAITENDYRMASSVPSSVLYGFNVGFVDPKLQIRAKQDGVPVKVYNVIYNLIDDLKKRMTELIHDAERDEIVGKALVMQEFVVDETRKLKVHVAGCRCNHGTFKRHDTLFKLIRKDEVIASDMKVRSLKHVKDDRNEIKQDEDCGISFLGHEDLVFKPNDTLVCYSRIRYKPKLQWDIQGFA